MGEKIVVFPISRPVLTSRNAREYYGHRSDFLRIVGNIGSPENRKKLIEKIETELSRNQEIIILKQQILLLERLSIGAMCALGIPVILWFFNCLSVLWVITVLVGILMVLFQVGNLTERRQKDCDKRRKTHFDKYTDSLQRAEDRDIELINRIEEEWDRYCVDFSGYPPDWKYRKMLVLERDHHTCVECGWPKGVKRMVRELHVHHMKPLSRNGDNALTNLATLCDICHRKQEGPGHARINPRRRKKK